MARKSVFIYSDALSEHTLSETHPMKPARLRYTYELLQAYNAFDAPNVELAVPRQADDDEILSFHTADYLNALKAFDKGDYSINPALFNFGPGDNPVYEGIYTAQSLSAGASMAAVEALLGGADAAFSISGGLHHAMRGYTYGFCVFNDPVMAINEFLKQGMRVAYVDIDCHHGDGVQYAYYDTDAVLTISLHESGAFLFPGTGYVQETGAGRGRGYSVNVPLYPYTSDEDYLWAFREVVPPLLSRFRPDALVTQLGIDSHYLDPITHLALRVQGFKEAVSELANLAPAKWLALGGGGYDVQAVARAWAVAFGVMSEQTFSDEAPEPYKSQYGVESLYDPDDLPIDANVKKDSRAFAESSVQAAHRLIFPSHGIITA